jgi:hypothetical protein
MHQVFFDPLLRFSCYGNVMAGSWQAEVHETAEVHDETRDEASHLLLALPIVPRQACWSRP